MKTVPMPPNDGRLCQVQRQHVMSIRTAHGAWTRKQLKCLGVDWPPRRGWMRAFNGVGRQISVADWEVAAEDAGLVVKS